MAEREAGKVLSIMKSLTGIATSSGIEPSKFRRLMAKRWEEYGNVAEGNDKLLGIWGVIAREFNFRIALAPSPGCPASNKAKKFKVIPAPTGTGKTQSLIQYCVTMSELSDTDHPGILIVARRIDDCNNIYSAILREGRRPNGKPACIAYHTESGTEISELSNYPVAIITHAQFRNAVHIAKTDNTVHNKLYSWGSYQMPINNPLLEKMFPGLILTEKLKRKLTVVDECLNLIDDYSVDVSALRECICHLPKLMHEKHSNEIEAIKAMVDMIDKIEKEGSKLRETLIDSEELMCRIKEKRILAAEELLKARMGDGFKNEEDVMPSLTRFLENFNSIGYKHLPYDKKLQQSQHKQQINAVFNLQKVWQEWLYFEKIGNYQNIRSSRRIVPENCVGAVVLDATAEVNSLYPCTPDAEVVDDVPKNARTYRKATLHIGYGYKVGKDAVDECMYHWKRARDFLKKVSEVTGTEKTLIITHETVENHFIYHANKLRVGTDYSNLSDLDRVVTQGLLNINPYLEFNHWFNLDGRNDYRSCRRAFILSLPYPPQHYSATSFMALKGVQVQKWFSESEFGGFTNYRQELYLSKISNDVIQGINRIATREVNTKDGDCPECHIYILLPGKTDHVTKRLLNDIKHEMPGLVFDHDWDFDFDYMRREKKGRKKGSTSNSTAKSRLADFAKSSPGLYSIKELKDLLQGGARSIRDACTKLGFSNKALAGFPACYDIA